MNLVIFRENTEDVYAGIEWEQGTADGARLIEFLNKDMLKGGKKQIRLDSGVGIKPISVTGTKRLVRMAIQHALENKTQVGHARPQGQHSEIYRRRVPQVGIRNRHRRVPQPSRHRARELDHRQQRQESEPHRRAECQPDRARPRICHGRLPPGSVQRSERLSRLHLRDARQGRLEEEAPHQRPHRRLHLPAGRDARRRIQRAGHAESQRRLHLRRLRCAGRRTRHRSRSEHRRRLSRSSRLRTAPRPSMPTKTSSIQARSFSRA